MADSPAGHEKMGSMRAAGPLDKEFQQYGQVSLLRPLQLPVATPAACQLLLAFWLLPTLCFAHAVSTSIPPSCIVYVSSFHASLLVTSVMFGLEAA